MIKTQFKYSKYFNEFPLLILFNHNKWLSMRKDDINELL